MRFGTSLKHPSIEKYQLRLQNRRSRIEKNLVRAGQECSPDHDGFRPGLVSPVMMSFWNKNTAHHPLVQLEPVLAFVCTGWGCLIRPRFSPVHVDAPPPNPLNLLEPFGTPITRNAVGSNYGTSCKQQAPIPHTFLVSSSPKDFQLIRPPIHLCHCSVP